MVVITTIKEIDEGDESRVSFSPFRHFGEFLRRQGLSETTSLLVIAESVGFGGSIRSVVM
ncbi:hypothetical protein P3S68_031943 [Capsicum galapagoense]